MVKLIKLNDDFGPHKDAQEFAANMINTIIEFSRPSENREFIANCFGYSTKVYIIRKGQKQSVDIEANNPKELFFQVPIIGSTRKSKTRLLFKLVF